LSVWGLGQAPGVVVPLGRGEVAQGSAGALGCRGNTPSRQPVERCASQPPTSTESGLSTTPRTRPVIGTPGSPTPSCASTQAHGTNYSTGRTTPAVASRGIGDRRVRVVPACPRDGHCRDSDRGFSLRAHPDRERGPCSVRTRRGWCAVLRLGGHGPARRILLGGASSRRVRQPV